MTYEDLRALGFSDDAILAQGISKPKESYPWTANEIGEAWKKVKYRVENKIGLTSEEQEQFNEMKKVFTKITGRELTLIKGA